MQKTTEKRNASNANSHGGLHSGILAKRLKRDVKRDVKESSPMLAELWDQSAPRIARFYRSNWRRIAVATTGVAMAAIGAYYLSSGRKPMRRFMRRIR